MLYANFENIGSRLHQILILIGFTSLVKTSSRDLESKIFTNEEEIKLLSDKKELILVTGHRRENHGKGFLNICYALKQIAEKIMFKLFIQSI